MSRISHFIQLASGVLALIMPPVYYFYAGWHYDIFILTGYAWFIFIVAALWDKMTWRR